MKPALGRCLLREGGSGVLLLLCGHCHRQAEMRAPPVMLRESTTKQNRTNPWFSGRDRHFYMMEVANKMANLVILLMKWAFFRLFWAIFHQFHLVTLIRVTRSGHFEQFCSVNWHFPGFFHQFHLVTLTIVVE